MLDERLESLHHPVESKSEVNDFWTRVQNQLDEDSLIAVITVIAADGSTPREVGAQMAVTKAGDLIGTIGGGALEYAAIADARLAMTKPVEPARKRDWPLGPDLGQCCGGRVTTLIEVFQTADQDQIARFASEPHGDRTPLLLFGAGHVGRALVMALAPLPFDIRWIDSRAEAFPPLVVRTATPVLTDHPLAEIANASRGAFVLVMTHSHALDLDIITQALQRPDLGYVGLIGSATKRARFESRIKAMGGSHESLSRLICPIGLPGIHGKEPATIAASVAADLLIRREGLHKPSERASFPNHLFERADPMDIA